MFWSVTQSLLGGLLTTFQIFIFTLLFALPLGLVLAFGSISRFRPLRYLIQVLVWIIRGTPLMLQLIIIFYGPGLYGAVMKLGGFRLPLWRSVSITPAISQLFSVEESRGFRRGSARQDRCLV